MNREIKFRFYCSYNKEMYYDDDESYEIIIKNGEFSYLPLDNDSYCFYSNIADDLENDCLNIIPMQFTGLKDKNGKEIYEGDIIEMRDYGKNYKFIVKYINSGFYSCGIGTLKSINLLASTNKIVVGNIYENPELIENN